LGWALGVAHRGRYVSRLTQARRAEPAVAGAVPSNTTSLELHVKIAIVSAFYSEGMGYSENCLSKALAKLGHDVHVVTSTYNVYGNEALYDVTYREFLGPRKVHPGEIVIDGYTVHRLKAHLVSGYVRLHGMNALIRALAPDIVHSLEVGSLQTYELAALNVFGRFKLFTETHQTMSVMRPYMRNPDGQVLRRLVYRATRTLPTFLSSLTMELCYAVTPDCAEVARRFYGVPEHKIRLLSLGADTDMFHPVESDADEQQRQAVRRACGCGPEDILCVYTGRFTNDKNPLVLARAIDRLVETDPRYKGLFIGDGAQKEEIAKCRNLRIVPFMKHTELAQHYRAADLGVWPRQESMSMIDAAASGIPIIASNRMGEPGRVQGNGMFYEENDVASLVAVLKSLAHGAERRRLGSSGRKKMLEGFSWNSFARTLDTDFKAALAGRGPRS
jgi:glycosyltransferase involved in cell wall biosynthesis